MDVSSLSFFSFGLLLFQLGRDVCVAILILARSLDSLFRIAFSIVHGH